MEDIITQNFKNARLLVIEDNDDYWLLGQIALRQALPEIAIERVSDHRQVIPYLERCAKGGLPLPKLILQDLYIPKRADGLQLLKELRQHFATSAYPQLPIIVTSTSTDASDVFQCYIHGASSYMVKVGDIKQQIVNYMALREYWWETSVLPFTEQNT